MAKRKPSIVVGVDLAGSPSRPTGVCILRGLKAQTSVVFGDEEIIELIKNTGPDLVTVDAPLSLPEGRTTIHDRSGGHFRECDRELRRRGIRFFPVTIGPMRMLTERGMALKTKVERMDCPVMECYPGAAQDVWGIPRQHRDRKGLREGLKDLGVKGLAEALTGDELDAVTAALVGRWLLLGKGEIIGGSDGIVMPAREKTEARRGRRSRGQMCNHA
ncbi:MAG TPA: DUF429 domain-containing protein [Syntrophales bacterium]|nr:DUF429 domain-containing protein [Syntrophobacterales bacterium]HRR40650.1 DUF429 domain-containing protein [Syntrophales bacterium]HRT26618.1 DUF429 domain-containing protein [Syntrophales bacterium]HRT69871.1 DUF429 domain-containing protein [Syntrophales bacterium]